MTITEEQAAKQRAANRVLSVEQQAKQDLYDRYSSKDLPTTIKEDKEAEDSDLEDIEAGDPISARLTYL